MEHDDCFLFHIDSFTRKTFNLTKYLTRNTMSGGGEDSALDLLLGTTQVITLSVYNTLVTLLGILGNTLVIYSSLRYNSIKLDQVSLLFVQNLALADLLYIFCNILPTTITLITRSYVLGQVYCFISAQISFIPGSVNTLTILALTAYRLRLVYWPLSSFLSTRAAKFIILAVWVLATIAMDVSLGFNSKSVFVQTSAKCFSTIYQNEAASTIFTFTIGIIVFVPIIGITVINTILCVIAYRASRHDPSDMPRSGTKALTTVCLLSGFFIVSWAPYMVYVVWKSRSTELPLAMELLALQAIQINTFVNPILYTFTNKRFGKYVVSVIRGMVWRKSDNSSWRPSVQYHNRAVVVENKTAVAIEGELKRTYS